MSLIGNGFRENTLGKLFGGTSLNGANPSVHEYWGHLTARMRNQFAGEGISSALASVPSGARHPVAWVLAEKNGAMASRNTTVLSVGVTGLAVGGITTNAATGFSLSATNSEVLPLDTTSPLRTGSATMAFLFADASGELIASGSGAADFSIAFANALLLASVNGGGAAEFTISLNTPTIGAIASGGGYASIVINPSNTSVLPSDDTSPLRTGAASMTFAGTLAPYAVGVMSGSTIDAGVLTSTSIAQAVWAALSAANNDIGTMGQKLNSAASGGVDYGDLALAVRAELAAELARIDAAITTRATAGDIFAAV